MPSDRRPGLFAALAARLRNGSAAHLARASLVVLGLSGVARAVGLGKEVLVAALFGVSGLLDAYVLALLVPSFLANQLGASFASALVPALARQDRQGRPSRPSRPSRQSRQSRKTQGGLAGQGAGRLLAQGLLAQALVLAVAVLAVALFPAEALRALAPGAQPERLADIKTLQLALLPLCVLTSLGNTLGAVANYGGEFRGPALAGVANAVAAVLGIGLLHQSLGVLALAAGVSLGAALEFAALAWLCRKPLRAAFSALAAGERGPEGGPEGGGISRAQGAQGVLGAREASGGPDLSDSSDRAYACARPGAQDDCSARRELWPADTTPHATPPRAAGRDGAAGAAAAATLPAHKGAADQGSPLAALLRGWGLLALGASLLGLTPLVDNAIATTLGEGAVATLSYAVKLPLGLAGLLGLTVSTVLLPHFTTLVHTEPEAVRSSCRDIARWLLLLAGPLALAGALASPVLVELLFQRGRFTAQAAQAVSAAQVWYFIQLPFYLLCIAATRMLQALARLRFLLLLQAGLLLVSAATSFALSRVLGAPGIAASSALMHALFAGAALWAVRRQCREAA